MPQGDKDKTMNAQCKNGCKSCVKSKLIQRHTLSKNKIKDYCLLVCGKFHDCIIKCTSWAVFLHTTLF